MSLGVICSSDGRTRALGDVTASQMGVTGNAVCIPVKPLFLGEWLISRGQESSFARVTGLVPAGKGHLDRVWWLL